MLVLISIQTVALGKMTVAIDPWKVEQISPAPFEENICNVNMSSHHLRVESSFEDLVTRINNARMGGKQ